MSPGATDPLASPTYVATPVATATSPGPWPGVVVLHDAFGLSDDIREQADWLAAAGYLAVVPDLYGGRSALRCIRGMFAQLSLQEGPAFDQVEQVRAALSATPDCTGSVGVIGYCMGGAFALLLAGRPGWSASSVNYGITPENVADVLSGACPVVASYGGRDKGLRGAAQRVREAAEDAGIPHDVTEYPQARHGFINRLAQRSPLVPLLKVAGVGYDHDAAADAKRRILAFFDTHLRQPTQPSAQPSARQ